MVPLQVLTLSAAGLLTGSYPGGGAQSPSSSWCLSLVCCLFVFRWFLLRVVDASYSLGIFANGAYEADTAQDHYYYVGIDTAYWTGHSP